MPIHAVLSMNYLLFRHFLQFNIWTQEIKCVRNITFQERTTLGTMWFDNIYFPVLRGDYLWCKALTGSSFLAIHEVDNIDILVQFVMERNWKQLRGQLKFQCKLAFTQVLWIYIEMTDFSILIIFKNKQYKNVGIFGNFLLYLNSLHLRIVVSLLRQFLLLPHPHSHSSELCFAPQLDQWNAVVNQQDNSFFMIQIL